MIILIMQGGSVWCRSYWARAGGILDLRLVSGVSAYPALIPVVD
jgi:hypothetical protein